MNVVIVELAAKAQTINKYLGRDFNVIACYGHVRDLPPKDGSVDPEDDFAMIWEMDAKGAKRVAAIAELVKKADKVILATDPDREGEAISWHLLDILNKKRALKDKAIERVVFNAVTKDAIREAMAHPRQIDQALVDAYLARRALDYLVGFTLSPVLWRKLPGARSAGRVQSVALRLVCERELEIEKFVSREYWSLVAHLKTARDEPFIARLVGADGRKITRLDIGEGKEAEDFKKALDAAQFKVRSVEAKPIKRHPYAPFTTSTLQQEASRKLGLAPAHTMRIAQRLYEGVDIGGESAGLITYMRTDGVDMAPEAIASIRTVIGKQYGERFVPKAPRKYTAKAKNAQEAHEAIRPTDASRLPKDMARHLEPEQAKLYELIWNRAVASQMESAELERTTVDIDAKAGASGAGAARHRPGRALRRLSRTLSGRPRRRGRRGRRPPAPHGGRRARHPREDRRDPAFHRAAAALHRGDADQAHGGAGHRPALDLRLHGRRARRARLCADREKASRAGGQGPAGRRLSRELFRALRRI